MFLDETIDPDIPTDPNELALYKRYGRNWRNVVMGSTMRDRGGNFDRGMRFMHSTPEGFMQRPSMQSTQQVQQSNIDQSGFFAQLQKLQNEYNQALQEYYKYMSTPQYDQMQDYYAGNYQDYYGGGSGSQDPQYTQAQNQNSSQTNQSDPGQVVGGTITSSTGEQGLNLGAGPVAGGGPPPPVLIPQVHRAAKFEPPEMKVAAPAAPTLNSYIPRYERAEATGSDIGKVKTVEPVKTVVKPATSFKTSKGNVGRK